MTNAHTATTLRYLVDEKSIAVIVDDPDLQSPLRRLFPAYVDRTQTTRLPAADSVVRVRTAADGWIVETADGEEARCTTLQDLLSATEFRLTRAFLVAHAGRTQLHAAGAVVQNRAVLAAGVSGAGKSSLATAWASAGHLVLGDDIVFLDGPLAGPFKRLFKVGPQVMTELGLDATTTPFWNSASDSAWYDPNLGGWAASAPVKLLAFPTYRAGAPTILELLNTTTRLELLLHSVVETGLPRSACFDDLSQLAESTPGYRIVFGSAADAARTLIGQLQS